MFKFLTDSIENALRVGEVLIDPDAELPTRKEIAKLLADGLTVYAAAEVLGVGVEVIEHVLGDTASEGQ